jgi:hypothetical protein
MMILIEDQIEAIDAQAHSAIVFAAFRMSENSSECNAGKCEDCSMNMCEHHCHNEVGGES